MKGYTSITKIESYLTYTIEEYFVPQVEAWIASMEKYIDNYTRRNFIADAEPSARLFDGLGGVYLGIDDCISITKVELGNDSFGDNFTEIDAGGLSGYYKLPTNNEADNYPIDKLMLRNSTWTIGIANNRVTARWGYSETVPEDIELATTLLVSLLISANSNIAGKVTNEKIGNYQVALESKKDEPDYIKAIEILDSYKRYLI